MSPQSNPGFAPDLFLLILALASFTAIWLWLMSVLGRVFLPSPPPVEGEASEVVAVANQAHQKLGLPEYFATAVYGFVSLIGLHLLTSFHLATLKSSGWEPPFFYVLLMRLVALLGSFSCTVYSISRLAKVSFIFAAAWVSIATTASLLFSGVLVLVFWVWG